MKKLQISLILLGAVALSSCSKPNPSPKDVETQIKLALPPWMDVSIARQEVLEPRENDLVISYEAQISPKEDLYVPDAEAISKAGTDLGDLLMPADPLANISDHEINQMAEDDQFLAKELAKLHMIKLAAAAGEVTRIYGKIGTTRTGKTFQFSTPQIETQPPVFAAKPKSSYPDTIVTASPEHKMALEQISKKIKNHQAEVQQQKEKRIEQIRAAFAAGKTYQGTWTQPGAGNTGQIALIIDESDGKTFKAHLYDPEKSEEKKPAQGIIVYDSETHQARIVGINGQGNPHVKIKPEGVGILLSMQMTAATTNYHFLEVNAAVDFELQMQPDGTLKGTGKSGRGEPNKLSLQPKGN